VKPAPSRTVTERVQGIDVLRGLCILAVVIHHINLRIRFDKTAFAESFPAASRLLFWSGYYGVIVFFVISGFLITAWSLKRWGILNKVNRRQFYLMRFARIAPCLAGLLVILSILDLSGVPRFVINTQHTSLPRALLAAITFHINWLEAQTGYLPASWDVLWSLSIEEVFYLFFPLLCTLVRSKRALVSLLCAFVVIGPFARTVLTHNAYWADNGYLSCMDGIALGCLAAVLAQKIKFGAKALWALASTGTLLCIFIVVLRGLAVPHVVYKIGLDVTVLELGTALLVITSQQRAERTNVTGHWSTAPLRWFGRNSYEVYLTHMFVIWPMVWVLYRLREPLKLAPLCFVVTAVLAGTLGYVVAKFYSEPLNRALRARFMASRRILPVAAATSR
jgi:peptidoglycan/LPS O-acetylase OafA/YrhL